MHTSQKIIANQVADKDRLDFTPRLFGQHFLHGEQLVYVFMRRLCCEYYGGYWQYYELSNGGMYMAPSIEQQLRLTWEMNCSDEQVSADAAGIVATLFALNHVICTESDNHMMIERFYALKEYAAEHGEAREIYRLID